jgi:hypothetical protein
MLQQLMEEIRVNRLLREKLKAERAEKVKWKKIAIDKQMDTMDATLRINSGEELTVVERNILKI